MAGADRIVDGFRFMPPRRRGTGENHNEECRIVLSPGRKELPDGFYDSQQILSFPSLFP